MKSLQIIIPAYNEEKNIQPIIAALKRVTGPLHDRYSFEFVFVNDGSSDGTQREIDGCAASDPAVKCIEFSRNFGKELAMTAGINACQADACILIDADLQHPVSLIPEFIARWEKGFEVVIGVRNRSRSDAFIKRIGSALFYRIINRIAEVKVVPNATDYRLLDRVVVIEFNRFTEANRMTRALIDWLGFRRDCIAFDADDRINGKAGYSFSRLFRLAVNSFVSLSLVPLKFAGYLGTLITAVSGVSGLYIFFGKYFLHLPFASTFSDSENLAILILFLVGILLISIGLLAMYVANIHREIIGRPMYVVRTRGSARTVGTKAGEGTRLQ